MNRKILVTGGAGFIGSHLVRHLLSEGDSVTCLDNLFTGSLDNLQDVMDSPLFRFVEGDVEEDVDDRALFPDGLDQIYNLACPASPVHYQQNPVKTVRTNVLGAINMLELARRTHARVLQASTSEVYGDPVMHPQKESYWGNVNTIGIRSCYDEGKRVAETLFTDYHRQYGVDIRIIRIFNTYGPSMQIDDGRVISNFIVELLRGEDITIYGSGQQTRSFCYVSDLIRGMTAMMDNEEGFIGPVNLGNPSECTIRELADRIRAMMNPGAGIVCLAMPEDDPKQRKPDISLAKEKLAFSPVVSMDEGLSKTIAYFEQCGRDGKL